MNAVGRFGELIIKYQLGIEIGLLALLGIMVIAFLVQLVRRAAKRKAVLTEIEERVQDISEAMDEIAGSVSGLSFAMMGLEEKQSELSKSLTAGEIGRIEAEEAASEEIEIALGEGVSLEPEGAEEVAEVEEADESAEDRHPQASWLFDPLADDDRGEEEAVKSNPSLRYYSRDWGTDKHGKVYTEEMLREQIG